MTTARDRFHYTRTLCCLLKALEGVETEIELRNDSSVKGTLEFVSGSMSVTMRNCVLIVNDRPRRLQQMSIQGRKIRMVAIPDDIDMLSAMECVIDMYNAPILGRQEFRRGRGRARGGARGRGRSRGRGASSLQGDRRGRGPAGKSAADWGRGQAVLELHRHGDSCHQRGFSREESYTFGAMSGVNPVGTRDTIPMDAAGVPDSLYSQAVSQQNLPQRLLAHAMGGLLPHTTDSGDTNYGKGRSYSSSSRDSSPEHQRRTKSGWHEKSSHSQREKSRERDSKRDKSSYEGDSCRDYGSLREKHSLSHSKGDTRSKGDRFSPSYDRAPDSYSGSKHAGSSSRRKDRSEEEHKHRSRSSKGKSISEHKSGDGSNRPEGSYQRTSGLQRRVQGSSSEDRASSESDRRASGSDSRCRVGEPRASSRDKHRDGGGTAASRKESRHSGFRSDDRGSEDLRTKLLRKKGTSGMHDEKQHHGNRSDSDSSIDRRQRGGRDYAGESHRDKARFQQTSRSPEHSRRSPSYEGDYPKTCRPDRTDRKPHSRHERSKLRSHSDSDQSGGHGQSADAEHDHKSKQGGRHHDIDRGRARVSSDDPSCKDYLVQSYEGSPSSSPRMQSPGSRHSSDSDHCVGSDGRRHLSDRKGQSSKDR